MCLNRFHSMQKRSQAASGPRRIEATHKHFLKHPAYLENIIISLFPTRKTASPNPVPSWQVCLSTILHPQAHFNYHVSNLTYGGLQGYRTRHRKLQLRGKSIFLSIISESREPASHCAVWDLVFPLCQVVHGKAVQRAGFPMCQCWPRCFPCCRPGGCSWQWDPLRRDAPALSFGSHFCPCCHVSICC